MLHGYRSELEENFPDGTRATIVHQHTDTTFYTFFEEYCRQIFNYSLPPRKKTP